MSAGTVLRDIRHDLGLSLKEVSNHTRRLAAEMSCPELGLSVTEICYVEIYGIPPREAQLYALAKIYNRSFHELAAFFQLEALIEGQSEPTLELNLQFSPETPLSPEELD